MQREQEQNSLGGLRIFVRDHGREDQLTSHSYRYGLVKETIQLAVQMLETSEGRQSLAKISKAVVFGERPPPLRRSLRLNSPQDLPYYIDKFLGEMRLEFPIISLVTGIEGGSSRQINGDSRTFASRLLLSEGLYNDLIYTMQNPKDFSGDAFENLMFRATINAAREILRFLMIYFFDSLEVTQEMAMMTRLWEQCLLGGVVEFFRIQSDSGKKQVSIPHVIGDKRQDSSGLRISASYVREFTQGEFSFPARVETSHDSTRRELRNTHRDAELRNHPIQSSHAYYKPRMAEELRYRQGEYSSSRPR